ncbi:MAG: DHH family phosphoesterase [Caldilineaceae bacterium]
MIPTADNLLEKPNEASEEDASTGATVERYATFADALEAHRGEHHVIVLQDFPDPDAIASAFVHRLLSAEYDIDVDILYSGRISHQQNIALVKLLGFDLTRYTPAVDLAAYDAAIFVDNQGTTAREIVQMLEENKVPPLMIIDHHEAQDRLQPAFADIRRTVSATSTIYTDYLEQGLLTLEKARKEHVAAATALLHGIISDTSSFVFAQPADFQAAAYLSNIRDADLLRQVMNQARSKQTMENIRRALENRMTVENYSIAGIGYLRVADRDSIPQAAEFLMSEENVHTAIVYGILADEQGKEVLIGSMRTTKITIDPDEFIKDVFGKDATGHYFGGGRRAAGGFEIPVGFLADGGGGREEYQTLKWQVYDAQVKEKIFTKIR